MKDGLFTPRAMRAQGRGVAPARFRFWSRRGYPYLLVIDVENEPQVVARLVHQSRDLPSVLDDA